MSAYLRAVAATQDGLFTRTQAITARVTERQLRTATRPGGEWVVVRRGVYVERAVWESFDDDGKYRLSVRAAVVNARPGHVVSHTSAAALHGLPMRTHWQELVHLTHTGVLGGRTEHGVKHHPAAIPLTDLHDLAGVWLTSLARTAVDIAREHGYEDGVVACDAVRRRGVRREELDRVVRGMRCWPQVTKARAAVEDSDAGAESIGESMTRLLLIELGLGRPHTQVVLHVGGRTFRADLALGRHLVEFDGRRKYVDRTHGGWAERPADQVVWEEKLREDLLRGAGYGMSRVVWADLFGVRRRDTLVRLDRDIRATWARTAA